MGKRIRVHSALTAFEAHIVKSALEQAGIEAFIRNEMLASLAGAMPLTEVMAEVWIDESDAAAAQEVLAPVLARQRGEMSVVEASEDGALSLPEEAPDVVCAACNETSPGHFSSCWNCGAALPAAQ